MLLSLEHDNCILTTGCEVRKQLVHFFVYIAAQSNASQTQKSNQNLTGRSQITSTMISGSGTIKRVKGIKHFSRLFVSVRKNTHVKIVFYAAMLP